MSNDIKAYCWVDENNPLQCAWVIDYLSLMAPPISVHKQTSDYFSRLQHQLSFLGTVNGIDSEQCKADWEKAVNERKRKWLDMVDPADKQQCEYLIEHIKRKNIESATGQHCTDPYFQLLDLVWNWSDDKEATRQQMKRAWSTKKSRNGKIGCNLQISQKAHKALKKMAEKSDTSMAYIVDRMILAACETPQNQQSINTMPPLQPAKNDPRIDEILKEISCLKKILGQIIQDHN